MESTMERVASSSMSGVPPIPALDYQEDFKAAALIPEEPAPHELVPEPEESENPGATLDVNTDRSLGSGSIPKDLESEQAVASSAVEQATLGVSSAEDIQPKAEEHEAEGQQQSSEKKLEVQESAVPEPVAEVLNESSWKPEEGKTEQGSLEKEAIAITDQDLSVPISSVDEQKQVAPVSSEAVMSGSSTTSELETKEGDSSHDKESVGRLSSAPSSVEKPTIMTDSVLSQVGGVKSLAHKGISVQGTDVQIPPPRPKSDSIVRLKSAGLVGSKSKDFLDLEKTKGETPELTSGPKKKITEANPLGFDIAASMRSLAGLSTRVAPETKSQAPVSSPTVPDSPKIIRESAPIHVKERAKDVHPIMFGVALPTMPKKKEANEVEAPASFTPVKKTEEKALVAERMAVPLDLSPAKEKPDSEPKPVDSKPQELKKQEPVIEKPKEDVSDMPRESSPAPQARLSELAPPPSKGCCTIL